MNDQKAKLDWRDGIIPVSQQFDDPYFSLAGGLDETAHVFLAGNDLPSRFGGAFRIAETGFGTGLNFLAAWRSFEAAGRPGTLHFTSFEGFPMSAREMGQALSAFPDLAPWADQLVRAVAQRLGRHDFGPVTLEVILGDVRQTLPAWDGRADAWFLDGFSPAKNPEMWGAGLMAAVARHTAPGGTAATYTAAGHVRRALANAGFDVVRAPGYGTKRHMTRARMPA